MFRIAVASTCLITIAFSAGCARNASGPSSSGSGANITVAVIPKGTTHAFWKSVEAGAREAGNELGVTIQWKGPLKENDRAQQINIVQQFVSDNVSGIVLAPLDDTALVKPVESARNKNIPVVIFDSALKGTAGKDFVSLVATDNHKGGVLGGERMVELLGGKGKIVVLRYQEGSASTMEREEGFMEVMQSTPGIEILVENRYAGPTVGEAKTAAMDLVDQLKQADGVYCPNESSTMGMLLALRQNNLAGKVKFVGFDTSEPLLEALKSGDIDALVAQNPRKMGYEGVKCLVSKIRGEQVPIRIDTGVTVVDARNLESDDVKAILQAP